jgi:LysR family transcriptional activator of nhaA
MINWKHLHDFRAVAREGGVTRASERPHLTTKTISGQLSLPEGRPQLFRVGAVDVVPKSIAHRILMPVLEMPEPVHMVCREASLDALLAELTVHRLDLVPADRPIPPTVSTQGLSHKLGECAVSFFVAEKLEKQLKVISPIVWTGRRYRCPAAVISCFPALTSGWANIASIRV